MTMPHLEADLAIQSGVARHEIRRLRSACLIEGVDWALEGRDIKYSENARTKLMELLLKKTPTCAPTLPPLTASPDQANEDMAQTSDASQAILGANEVNVAMAKMPKAAQAIAVAKLTRFCPKRNDLVVAVLDGREIRIKIPRKIFHRFAKGMAIPVVAVGGTDSDVFDLARIPRARGRF